MFMNYVLTNCITYKTANASGAGDLLTNVDTPPIFYNIFFMREKQNCLLLHHLQLNFQKILCKPLTLTQHHSCWSQ